VDLFHVWLQIPLAIEGVFLSVSINIFNHNGRTCGHLLASPRSSHLLPPFAMILSDYVQPTRL
jgi:hypothetical protein